MIRQVSSTLLSPTDKLKIQLSVGLVDSSNNPSYCSIYNSNSGSYLNISPNPHIVIRYTERNRPWDKMDNIYITQRNISCLRRELKDFYDTMMDHEDDIYRYGQSGYISSIGNTKKYQKAIPLTSSQIIKLEPIALYGDNGRPLPGVSMEINREDNLVELSIEEFESFYDLFQTIQLHQEGLILLQTYIITCIKGDGLKIPLDRENRLVNAPSSKNVRINIFESAEKKKSNEFVSGPDMVKQPTTLEEIE